MTSAARAGRSAWSTPIPNVWPRSWSSIHICKAGMKSTGCCWMSQI